MAPWEKPPLIYFEGEDEPSLKAKFVQLMAEHYPIHSEYAIGKHVFNSLREPDRYLQAVQEWMQDLDVAEAIRIYKLRAEGKIPPEVNSNWVTARLIAIADDPNLTSSEKNAQIKAIDLICEIHGLKVKPTDGSDPNKEEVISLPQIYLVERNAA